MFKIAIQTHIYRSYIVFVGLIVRAVIFISLSPAFSDIIVTCIIGTWMYCTYLYLFDFYYDTSDEPGGADKASDEKRKDQSTPVLSPSQGSPEAKEER